jgi:hypothetical protein
MRRPTAECPFEIEVADAVLGGRWSDVSLEALHMHARDCAACSTTVAVAEALRDDHASVLIRARVPAAGQVWWRATIRARMEGAQAAARPITWLQGAAAACVVGLGGAAATFAWPALAGTAERAALLMTGPDWPMAEAAVSAVAVVKDSMPLMLAVAGVTVLAPLLVLYFALAEGE